MRPRRAHRCTLRPRLEGGLVEVEFGLEAADLLAKLSGQCRIVTMRLRQQVDGLLETIQLMAIAFWFIGKGVGGGHQEIELIVRRQARLGKTMVLDEIERHGAKGLSLTDAEGEEEVVMRPRFFRSHACPFSPLRF